MLAAVEKQKKKMQVTTVSVLLVFLVAMLWSWRTLHLSLGVEHRVLRVHHD